MILRFRRFVSAATFERMETPERLRSRLHRRSCFPIDRRVEIENELKRHPLPVDEKRLVGLALGIGGNPRKIPRIFYEAGRRKVD